VALCVFIVPFCVGGIGLGYGAYFWLARLAEPLIPLESGLRLLSLPLATLFMLLGIALGGLLAYGILIFFMAWLAPNSPLLTEEMAANLTWMQRLFHPLFPTVGRFARWLARVCRNDAAA
jgi:hypothetical protein